MTRDKALVILKKYLHNENLIKHCYAAEAVMKALYRHFYGNSPEYTYPAEEGWGITGLNTVKAEKQPLKFTSTLKGGSRVWTKPFIS